MIHYGGENQDAVGSYFHKPSTIVVRNLLLVAPPGPSRHPSAGPVIGFANQSGDGAATSGRGSHLVPIDASSVQACGLTADTAGVPCRILSQRPDLELEPEWRLDRLARTKQAG